MHMKKLIYFQKLKVDVHSCSRVCESENLLWKYSLLPVLIFGVPMEQLGGLQTCCSRHNSSFPPPLITTLTFIPPAAVDTVNSWLSQIITSAFHAGVQSDLWGSALHVLLSVAHRLACSCDRLSCSAASGSERGIITLCPRAASVFGLARITWSSLCNSLSSSEVFWGHINNSRLPWRSHVSTNESSHQKSKVGQLSSSFSIGHLSAVWQRINSLLTAAQLRGL